MKPKQHYLSRIFLTLTLLVAGMATAHALSSFLTQFTNAYPTTTYPNAAALNDCVLCHIGNPSDVILNGYGESYFGAGHNAAAFPAIQNADSDGDGYINIVEITAGTFPGDASSQPTPVTYTVGGTVNGLSGTVVLQNNGGGNLSRATSGAFVFTGALAGGSSYRVTVLTQPNGQNCSVTNGSGTIGTASVTNVGVNCVNLPYTVGGTVSGLSGTVVLQNNAGGNLSRTTNGAFTFTGALTYNSRYNVTVLTQPTGQNCSVTNGSGTIGTASVTNVGVNCVNLPYTVGGTVSGLSGTVVLQNNAGGNLSRTTNGAFTFTGALTYNSTYNVTVLTQPTGQTCSVTNGTGTIGTANVANVGVNCVNLPPTTYTVGGTVSGLSGSVTLQNNGGGNLIRTTSGAFTFAGALASGSAYSVTVLTQPTGQTCSVANGTGTIGTANVANVGVNCVNLTYTVGGTVSGLSGSVTLQNNGGGNLIRTTSGAFTFAGALAGGSAYSVTVLTQPTGQTCSVANGTGTIGTANVANVGVNCVNLTYTVGGTVSGLSGSVTLQNNGGGNLIRTASGAFTFAGALARGSAYSVTVLTQPTGQTCSVTNGTGTIGTANVANVGVTCVNLPPTTYTVGGTVSGLSGSVTLQNNGGGNLIRTASGAFTFAGAFAGGSAYSVTVLTQPTGQTCSVANGSGTIGTANVANIGVTCVNLPPTTYTVGGTVSGLSGSVTLQNNGGGNLIRTTSGAFTFAGALARGSAYSVTVLTQPTGQTCSVANGTGTIGTANVANVGVTCVNLPPTTYTVGGTVSGLSGTVVLQNNGGGNLSRATSGAFAFTGALAGGSAYNVTVLTQPTGQTCSVVNGSGTIGTANVTNVGVDCRSISTAPLITITAPTTSASYTTSSNPIALSGTTTGSGSITSVAWADLNGGNGSATTSTSWTTWNISGVSLQSGINVITVTAADSSGKTGTATLTVTYNAPDDSGDNLSGMALWKGKWIRITMTQGGERGTGSTAYLNILSWDSNMRILRTNLYTPSSRSRRWDVTQLPLRYSSGTPLKFLFSFDYQGMYGFSGSLSGIADSAGSPSRGVFRANGLYLSVEEDEYERSEESDDHQTAVTMSGRQISSNELPSRVQPLVQN